jgi:hypothetical protein
MFNLLPETFKEKIKKEYKFRRLCVVFAFIILLQISFLIFLGPSWLISAYKESDLKMELDTKNISSAISDINATAYIIKSTNAKLTIINSTMTYFPFSPSMNAILASKNSSIHLNELIYASTGSSTANISVHGISNTRDALVTFVKSLKESNIFKSVDLPVSNLAKNKDIDFSITMTAASND